MGHNQTARWGIRAWAIAVIVAGGLMLLGRSAQPALADGPHGGDCAAADAEGAICESMQAPAYTSPVSQQPNPTPSPAPSVTPRPPVSVSTTQTICPSGGAPDVTLDVPNLSVDNITLEVNQLRARLNLDARVASLVSLNAGVDVSIERVSLTINGVKAEVHLTVCLDNVYKIIDRTLTSLDRNPQLLTSLVNSVTGLLNQTINTLGQTVLRIVDPTGSIVERIVDTAGSVVSENVVGNISTLPVLSETTNSAGQTVRQVRDTTGAVIEVILQGANILSTRVVSQGSGGAP